AEHVAAGIDRHPCQPSSRVVELFGRVLPGVHERLLQHIVGVGGGSGDAVRQSPQEGPMLIEPLRQHTFAWSHIPYCDAASRSTDRAAAMPLATDASANCPAA